MRNFLSRFKTLPLKTRQLLSLGLILALFVALPLFIWAITTQRFELRKKAQEVGPTPTALPPLASPTNPCEGYKDGTSCTGGGCPSPLTEPSGRPIPCTRPAFLGVCQNQECIPLPLPEPTPTLFPNPCEGQPDGTSCTGGGCPGPLIGPGGRPIPCTRPVFFGVCQNQACIRATPPGSPSCPGGDKGNLNCDNNGLINATDLSVLLSKWRTGPCPYPFGIQGGFSSPDLNNDCSVNATDLSILLSNWKPD